MEFHIDFLGSGDTAMNRMDKKQTKKNCSLDVCIEDHQLINQKKANIFVKSLDSYYGEK